MTKIDWSKSATEEREEYKQAEKEQSTPILELDHLVKTFHLDKHHEVRAVDGVSFQVNKGESFGLVGESGSGKSTIGRLIARLYPASSGKIIYEGKEISRLKGKELLAYRKKVQMIFQDPYASLNPRMKVRDIIGEGIDIHGLAASPKEREEKVDDLLELVGLQKVHGSRYPHEFSGGQRQRIGIARALAVEPEFIICDEPISALDVSIQAHIVNLLSDLQEKLGLTYLFIAHDLSMVKYFSDRIAMLYHGHLLELAEAEELYRNPQHPYTKSLLSAIPLPDPDHERERKRLIFDREVSNTGKWLEVTPNHYLRQEA
ncbi:ABC transporter ATP-binding protein [Atopobacter sp. AH10]|uniref:ABC transporter ATP-binding protein n=1 Tax=Atopobacter sp. AH10 TaxID=2315861 RepID=UPI000EF2168D|nr:ATP-binding cassette domain-containing protein [Atopobacter sp. AH10]RLK63473.1 ABC transporter ATP-binding protein [Atopobacter sp. AH10]